jgi:hypothetical protein
VVDGIPVDGVDEDRERLMDDALEEDNSVLEKKLQLEPDVELGTALALELALALRFEYDSVVDTLLDDRLLDDKLLVRAWVLDDTGTIDESDAELELRLPLALLVEYGNVVDTLPKDRLPCRAWMPDDVWLLVEL